MVQNNGNFSSHAFLEGFLACKIIMIIAMVSVEPLPLIEVGVFLVI